MVVAVATPQFVVDASIAMKWQFGDEEHAFEAERILTDFEQNRIILIAPDHLRYEVANALRTAVRTGRMSSADAREALDAFLQLGIATYRDDEMIRRGFDLAIQYDCAAYDGLYLALAGFAQCALLHADRRLRNTLAGRFARELWIEDYVAVS